MQMLKLLASQYQPPLPASKELRIGAVGAGNIMTNSHLPAYQKAGFRVHAIADVEREKAERAAAAFGIEHVYGSAEELIDDQQVNIVDLALPAGTQTPIALRAIAAGKHVQCHKPFALTLEEALAIVTAAEQANVQVGVNQQARWIPGVRATANLIREGMLGTPVAAAFDIAWLSPWQEGGRERRNVLQGDCVHHIDVARLWFGEPKAVYATGWHIPKQIDGVGFVDWVKVRVELIFSDQLHVSMFTNDQWWPEEGYAAYRVEGTEGFVRGTYEQYRHYGLPVPDQFEASFRSDRGVWYRPEFETRHLPDAFIGTMAQLMIAIETGGAPETSGRDNLQTMRALGAAERSIEERREVRLEEIELPSAAAS
jgi:predicted dehydrogenase